MHVRGRAPRADGPLMTVDVLSQLRESSFEYSQALRIVHELDGP